MRRPASDDHEALDFSQLDRVVHDERPVGGDFLGTIEFIETDSQNPILSGVGSRARISQFWGQQPLKRLQRGTRGTERDGIGHHLFKDGSNDTVGEGMIGGSIQKFAVAWIRISWPVLVGFSQRS